MAEVSFLPSANTRKRASASREGVKVNFAMCDSLQEERIFNIVKLMYEFVQQQIQCLKCSLINVVLLNVGNNDNNNCNSKVLQNHC